MMNSIFATLSVCSLILSADSAKAGSQQLDRVSFDVGIQTVLNSDPCRNRTMPPVAVLDNLRFIRPDLSIDYEGQRNAILDAHIQYGRFGLGGYAMNYADTTGIKLVDGWTTTAQHANISSELSIALPNPNSGKVRCSKDTVGIIFSYDTAKCAELAAKELVDIQTVFDQMNGTQSDLQHKRNSLICARAWLATFLLNMKWL